MMIFTMNLLMPSVIKRTANILNGVIAARMWFMKTNASTEVKKAEKLVAAYQTSRMLSKPGVNITKELSTQKTSTAFNSYLTGILSYNVQDATLRAHELHVKDIQSQMNTLLVVQAALNCTVSLLVGNYYRIPFIIALLLVGMITDTKQKQTCSHLICMLGSYNIVSIAMEIIFAITAYNSIIPSGLRWVNSIVYMAIKAIVSII